MMQLIGAKDFPVQISFWQQSVRHWTRSIGLWCCLMVGVVMVAEVNDRRGPLAEASVLAASDAIPGKVAGRSIVASPQVTLTYSTLDLSALGASAYGDGEF